MKKSIITLTCLALIFSVSAQNVNPAKDWKFGIALWTFHTGTFADALAKVDSAGLKYIEPNNFTKTLPELNDSTLMQLSRNSHATILQQSCNSHSTLLQRLIVITLHYANTLAAPTRHYTSLR